MRIITGSLGGRSFDSKSNSTHPMSEKMRGAIFNVLGDIEGLTFLDAFSGSGAIGFEALSRGAGSVVAVESNKFAQQDIDKNIKSLNLQNRIKLIKASVSAWSQLNENIKFNVIVCDPPYDKLQFSVINGLEAHLLNDGILVVSLPMDTNLPSFKSLGLIVDKKYGDSRLVFYRNSQ